jgi:hypothetical protein
MIARLTVSAGDRYGRLTIVKELPQKAYKYQNVRQFLVQCDCGEQRSIVLNKLTAGRVNCCKKCSIENIRKGATTHGMRRTKIYGTWMAMLSRCNNPNNPSYPRYGGRGVTVCERWDPSKGGSFENFYEDMGDCPAPGHQLDKEAVDPANKVYCPEMVRWVSKAENMRNTSRSRFITYQGRTMLVTEWAKELGLGVSCLHRRLFRSGWSIERAFTTPSRSGT